MKVPVIGAAGESGARPPRGSTTSFIEAIRLAVKAFDDSYDR
jgi:hypothetical protein